MRARAASKTGLSLTVAPRVDPPETANDADHRLARYVAWGALLVSAAAIAGHFLGPVLSDAPPEPGSSPATDSDAARDAA